MKIEAVPRFTGSQEQTRLQVPLVLVRARPSDIIELEAKALKALRALKAQQAQTIRSHQNQMGRELTLRLLLGSRHIPYV